MTPENIEKIELEIQKEGEEIIKYLEQYKGKPFYNDIAKAIEFGYHLRDKTE